MRDDLFRDQEIAAEGDEENGEKEKTTKGTPGERGRFHRGDTGIKRTSLHSIRRSSKIGPTLFPPRLTPVRLPVRIGI